jgi:hypothetical protein
MKKRPDRGEDAKSVDYSKYDYVTKWIGVNWCWNGRCSTDIEDDQKAYIAMIKRTGKIPVMYGYVISFEAKLKGIKDCDQGTPNLCQKGAKHIRENKKQILDSYRRQAKYIAGELGTKTPTVFLIEPDLYQYYRKNGQQEGGPLSGQEARDIFDGIVSAIKESLPNALISWDISPWAEDMNTWWGFFRTAKIDFIHTSGGQHSADNSKIDPQNPITWQQMSQLTGKKIIADSGLSYFCKIYT